MPHLRSRMLPGLELVVFAVECFLVLEFRCQFVGGYLFVDRFPLFPEWGVLVRRWIRLG